MTSRTKIFCSAIRSAGDLAGVFEYDGETGYFYLYDRGRGGAHKVIDAIHVVSGSVDFGEQEIGVHWNMTETMVGLFIRKQLWAAFDGSTTAKYGGDYCASSHPSMPLGIFNAFRN